MLASYVLPEAVWRELRSHARERGIEFLSTAFDAASLDVVCALGVPALKIGSGEITNRTFLHDAASRGLLVICSTGMATMSEVGDAIGWLSDAPQLALMHCVSSYPAPVDQCNVRAIATMSDAFGLPVGWSDHTVGVVSAVAAMAMGARIFEKHITLDVTRPGPDHAASADPSMFRAYVEQLHAALQSLGSGIKEPGPAESANISIVRRSWHAAKHLRAGGRVTPSDVVALRPEVGISAAVDLVGARIIHDVPRGEPLTAQDVRVEPS